MNLNNKYGNCCGCPALNDAREFTNYKSSSVHNSELMKKMGKTNSNDYRESLQINGESIIKNTYDSFETNYKCKNNGSNVFYLDSSNFNNLYENLNKPTNSANVVSVEKKDKARTPVNLIGDNMSLTALSFAPFN
jgi:hypothetical protein